VGIAEVWDAVLQHRETLESSGQLMQRRAAQARDWMWSEVSESLIAALQIDAGVRKQIPALEAAVSEGEIPPTVAAGQLLDIFLNHQKPGH